MTLWDYIDEVRKLTTTGTDYAVAKFLELPETTLNSWKKRGSLPDAATCFKIADILHIEREQVLIDINLAGAKREKERRVWERLAGKAAMIVSATCLICLWSSGDSWATSPQKQWSDSGWKGQKNDGIQKTEDTTCYKLYARWKRLKTKMRRFWETVAARMTLAGYAA